VYYYGAISQKNSTSLNNEKYVCVTQSNITVKCMLKQQRFQLLLETGELWQCIDVGLQIVPHTDFLVNVWFISN